MSLTKVTYAMIEGAVVNVLDYGADSTGSDDSYAAIQAAIDSLTSGGCVYLPSGSYSISDSLTIDGDNISIVGDGAGSSKIIADADSFDLLTIATGSSQITIEGIEFVGAATTALVDPQWAIFSDVTDASNNVTVKNCYFNNVNNGIACGNGTYYIVENNLFEELIGTSASNGYGVTAFGATGGYHSILGNTFIGTTGKGRHAVYLTNGTSYSEVCNNIVKDFNSNNLYIRATSAQPGVVGNLIDGNICTGGGDSSTNEAGAIVIAGNATLNTISNNAVSQFDNVGIIVTHFSAGNVCKYNKVTTNYVSGCSLQGIQITGASETFVNANRVYNCSQLVSGDVSGIELKSVGSGGAGDAVNPANCVFSNNLVSGADHKTAFVIQPATIVPTGAVVTNNIFYAGATAGEAVNLNIPSGVVVNYAWNISDQSSALSFADIKQNISRSGPFDFPSISANSTEELTRTVGGVDVDEGWTVIASPEGTLESGLVWSAYVSAANTVTLRVANVTSGAINPASRVWNLNCFKI